jgi:hypothetical protein
MLQDYVMKAYTGPVVVKEIASRVKSAGVDITMLGTEHIYVVAAGENFEDAANHVRHAIVRKCGRDFGLRFRSAR